MNIYLNFDNSILKNHHCFEKYQKIAFKNHYKYLSEMLLDLYFNKETEVVTISKIFQSSDTWIYNFFAQAGLRQVCKDYNKKL